VDGTPFTGGTQVPGDGSVLTWSNTYSTSVTITVGASLGFDITKALSVGADVSVSVTTGTAKAEGSSKNCPVGGWTCSLAFTYHYLQVDGHYSAGYCNDKAGPYTVLYPVVDSAGNANVEVEVCACKDFDGWSDPGAPKPCPNLCKTALVGGLGIRRRCLWGSFDFISFSLLYRYCTRSTLFW